MEGGVDDFIRAAVECALLSSPRDPGLTLDELLEVGERAGYRPGQLRDAVSRVRLSQRRGSRLLYLERTGALLSADFNTALDPEPRNVEAFDFVRQVLQELADEVGETQAKLPRDILVERGVQTGLTRSDLEVALTVTIRDGILVQTEDVVSHARHQLRYILPSAQIAQYAHHERYVSDASTVAQVRPLVEDAVARRSDGRPLSMNPLAAFADRLEALHHGRFRAWWLQKHGELRLLDPSLQPVAVTVLAASLAEAALTFVVPRAAAAGLMRLVDPNKPRSWRFVDLIKGAKSGDPAVRPLLDERTALRCLDLNDARQRIHAGFLIDAPVSGPIPDLRPEQARDALQTTETLVRKVLDWLDAATG